MINTNYSTPSFQGKFKDPNLIIERAKLNSLTSALLHSQKIKMPLFQSEKTGIKHYANRLKKVFTDFAQSLPKDSVVFIKKEDKNGKPSLNLFLKDSDMGKILLFNEEHAFSDMPDSSLSLSKFREMFSNIMTAVGINDGHRADALRILTKNKLNELIENGKFSKEQAEKIAAKYNL